MYSNRMDAMMIDVHWTFEVAVKIRSISVETNR